jgi:hypothetical protein
VRRENTLGSVDHRAILKFDLVIPLSQVLAFELLVHRSDLSPSMPQEVLPINSSSKITIELTVLLRAR